MLIKASAVPPGPSFVFSSVRQASNGGKTGVVVFSCGVCGLRGALGPVGKGMLWTRSGAMPQGQGVRCCSRTSSTRYSPSEFNSPQNIYLFASAL